MAKIYYRNVKNNGYPLERVPDKWKEIVADMLKADSDKEGCDGNE